MCCVKQCRLDSFQLLFVHLSSIICLSRSVFHFRSLIHFHLMFFVDKQSSMSREDASTILSRTLACLSLYQQLTNDCFVRSNYDPWKLLPKNSDEEKLYSSSCKLSMLRILLSCPLRHFKWQVPAYIYLRDFSISLNAIV